MTDDEMKGLMKRHGITAGEESVYYYKHFKYRNLMDAVNYAELVASRAKQPKGNDRSELRRASGLDDAPPVRAAETRGRIATAAAIKVR